MKQGQTIVLVTGATGFLGRRLVAQLVLKGYAVRALSRTPTGAAKLFPLEAEVVCGDVADGDTLRSAFEGVGIVVHAAADTAGTEEGARRTTIQGTENVVRFCVEFGVRELIYISSLNVYGLADLPAGSTLDEAAPLERNPEQRGFYTWGKVEAERVVLDAMREKLFPIVCLRPGTILGPGGEIFTPMMGFCAGNFLFLLIGRKGFVLPIVYIENLVDAVIAAIESENSPGRVYNVLEPEAIGKKDYVDGLLRKIHPRALFVWIPYFFVYSAVFVWEKLMRMAGRKPFLTRYRLASSQALVLYDASRIRRELSWVPPVNRDEAFAALIAHSRQESSRG